MCRGVRMRRGRRAVSGVRSERRGDTECRTREQALPQRGGGRQLRLLLHEGDSQAIAALQPAFPGIAVDPADAGAFHIRIPRTLRTTHEQHFAAVLDQFLALVDGADPPRNLAPDLITKYELLARAAELSHRR